MCGERYVRAQAQSVFPPSLFPHLGHGESGLQTKLSWRAWVKSSSNISRTRSVKILPLPAEFFARFCRVTQQAFHFSRR